MDVGFDIVICQCSCKDFCERACAWKDRHVHPIESEYTKPGSKTCSHKPNAYCKPIGGSQ